ncbi:hypothetical protein ADS79_15825 [Brevibacillus reuszeri]|uniref:Uncharacterized protein n=1 Tax=Brevibacillus reuszeri TaxID=54915 RepID=A0A0K9YNV3_9BACL|nr:hypothetical protein ADS79_15825 [Brevibacillus reuszeri]
MLQDRKFQQSLRTKEKGGSPAEMRYSSLLAQKLISRVRDDQRKMETLPEKPALKVYLPESVALFLRMAITSGRRWKLKAANEGHFEDRRTFCNGWLLHMSDKACQKTRLV